MDRKKKKNINSDEIDFDSPTRVGKTGFYLLLICGILVLIAGLDMTFSGSISSGWSPGGKFAAGKSGSVSGPTALIFALIILSFPIYAIIKSRFKKNDETN